MVEQTKMTQLSLAEGVTEPRAQTHAGPESALSRKKLGRGHYRVSWVLKQGVLPYYSESFQLQAKETKFRLAEAK